MAAAKFNHAWGSPWSNEEARVAHAVEALREGIDDTGIRAAFLKCAIEEHGVIGDLPLILDAIAAAALATGAPVMVHTNARARTGLAAPAGLPRRGVDPGRS